MWLQRRRGIETVSVTLAGVDGARETRTLDVGLGKDAARVIELPAGARSVRIERPVRERVHLGQLRGHRHTLRPHRQPGWRDHSDLWLRWEHWRTERHTRRTRRRQPR